MAATRIADEFRAFGLSPAGDDGTFIQRYPWTRTSMDPDRTAVHFQIAGNQTTAVFAQDSSSSRAAAKPHQAGWSGEGRPGRVWRLSGPDTSGQVVAMFLPGAMPDASWNAGLGAAFGAGIARGCGGPHRRPRSRVRFRHDWAGRGDGGAGRVGRRFPWWPCPGTR